MFVASGDSGAAGCDTFGVNPPAYQFLNISELCSSSYATCVGGTELVEGAGSFWATMNGPGLVSASGYIPEGAWNEPQLLSPDGLTYAVLAGGGGASTYIPKPAWQSGAGVPADGMRDVPDVSFPSAGHDGYYGCYAASGGDCSAGNYFYFYGTSGAAPSMAAVAALLDQKMESRQGNFNPLLYQIAASSPNAFHDATPSTISGTFCAIGTASVCNNSTPSTHLLGGGLAGFALTTGYDQATGLGSLDVANFVNAAAAFVHSNLAVTTLRLSANPPTITNSQTAIFTATVSSKVAGEPTGSVQFYANGIALGTPVAVVSGSAVTGALAFPAAGSYVISATYSGDISYASSTAPGTVLTVTGLTPTVIVTSSATTNVPVGTTATFTATVTPPSGTVTPTGLILFYSPGSTSDEYAAVVPLLGGKAVSPPIPYSSVGNYSMTAEYVGDSVYSPADSARLYFTVQKLATALQISTTGQGIGVNGAIDFGISVGSAAVNTMAVPTGAVQMYANAVAIGSPVSISSPAGSGIRITQKDAIVSFPSAGTFAITATYSGDANYLPVTATGNPVTVLSTPASYSMSAASSTMTFTAGNTFYNTDAILVNAVLGFTGTINATCSIVSNSGAVANPPTCTITPSPLKVVPNQASQLAVVINPVARSASRPAEISRGGRWGAAGEASVCAMLLWILPIRRRSMRGLAGLILFAAGFAVLSGCGNSKDSGSTPPSPAGTSAGSYTVTVTATSNTSVPAPPQVTIALTIN